MGQVSALWKNTLDEYSSKDSKLKMIQSCGSRIEFKKKKRKEKERRDPAKGLVEVPQKTVKGVKGSSKPGELRGDKVMNVRKNKISRGIKWSFTLKENEMPRKKSKMIYKPEFPLGKCY